MAPSMAPSQTPDHGLGAQEAGAGPAMGDYDTEVFPMPPNEHPLQKGMSSMGSSLPRRPGRRTAVIGMGLAVGLVALLIGGFLLAQSFEEEPEERAASAGEGDQRGEGAPATTSRGEAHHDIPSDVEGAPTTAAKAGAGCGYAGCGSGGSGRTKTTTSTPRRGPEWPTTMTTTLGTTTTVENHCYTFVANMRENPLQEYPENPDSATLGLATILLCTNGTMNATAMLHNGKSMIIATHIHVSNGGGGTNGANGEGPPVINFCGSNRPGMVDDNTPYPQECDAWDRTDAVKMTDMPGVLVSMFNRGRTVADRVLAIAAKPEMYFFNVHTFASWKKWRPNPKGICRGMLMRRDF